MKRTIAFFLLITMTVLLFSCQSKENSLYIIKGKTENNVYTNEYLNIKFMPGPGWRFEDGNSADDEKTVTDMYAVESKTGEYVQIRIEDLSMSFGGTLFNEDDYIKIIADQLKGSEAPAYTVSDTDCITVAGREFMQMSVREKDNESIGYKYLVTKADDYMITVIICDYNCDTSDYIGSEAILAKFFALS